jgi:hypothetical protein
MDWSKDEWREDRLIGEIETSETLKDSETPFQQKQRHWVNGIFSFEFAR